MILESRYSVPKVFISYSHDSEEHMDRVLELSDRLRREGIDCNIDRYELSPAQGWQRWLLEEVQKADFVLIACTEEYDRRFRGDVASGKGKGATWQTSVIIEELYNAAGQNSKFIPITLNPEDSNFIPSPLRIVTSYKLYNTNDYELLYRQLTNQPINPKQMLGELRSLAPRDRKQTFQKNYSLDSNSISMTSQPSSSQIRQLVEDALSDDDLSNLCQDEFPKVFKQFTTGQTKDQRIRLLVEYVDRQRELTKLLHEIERLNPSAYNAYHQEEAVTSAVKSLSRLGWSLILDGNLENISPEILESILVKLREKSNDASISLRETKKGSIVLVLEGTEEGFKIIKSLFETGELKEVMGLKIKGVDQGKSESKTYKYDVFISYSSKDRPWVKNTLVVELEAQEFKVCIDYRDFIIGKPSIINIEQSVGSVSLLR